MAAPMVRTRHPGIYSRGSKYVLVFRDGSGRQRKESVRTLREALALKAARQADVARGEFQESSRVTFRVYAEEWVERYQGRGSGLRESTREDYRRSLRQYAYPFFDERLRRRTLTQIDPRDIANFVGWLCDEQEQAKHETELARRHERELEKRGERPSRRHRPRSAKRLSDSTVRNILNPVRASLATAMAEGLIRSNPTHRVALPHRPREEDIGEDDLRVLTREQLATVLGMIHERHRLLFRLLAFTGLRIGEAIGLQWRHMALDGSSPHVKVRRSISRGRVSPPKTKYGRRDVPLEHELVQELRAHRAASEWPREEDLVFPSLTGTPIQAGNVRRRILAPVVQEAGVPFCGFHTLRHTCASLLFARGANAKQVQRWLGHHSAAFTLDRYIHLLSDELDAPLRMSQELPEGGNTVGASAPNPGQAGVPPIEANSPL